MLRPHSPGFKQRLTWMHAVRRSDAVVLLTLMSNQYNEVLPDHSDNRRGI